MHFIYFQIAESERVQQTNAASSGAEFNTLPAFDARNYYHINMLEAAAHCSHQQDQTALHLGYETKDDPAA